MGPELPGDGLADRPGEPLATGRVESPREFQEAVRRIIYHAIQAEAREMVWVSPDFLDWPLEDAALLAALSQWARRPGVRLRWMAAEFEALRRHRPRLVRWRQTWAHVLDCGAPADIPPPDLPTLLLVPGHALLQLFDTVHVRGRVTTERPDLGRAALQVDALLQRSVPAFPATTLGI
jgi:hypothetical protein